MDDFEKELIADFFVEANQLMDDTEQALLSLERNNQSTDLVNEIFRLAHTLKGSSRAVGLGEVASFTHELESLMMQLQKGQLKVTSPLVTLLLECNDHVRMMIGGLTENLDATYDSSKLIEKIKKGLIQK